MISTNTSGQTFPGLTLKAWAYVKSDGTLLKGMNVNSASRSGAGLYTVNFTSALSSTEWMLKVQAQQTTDGSGNTYKAGRTNNLTTGVNISVFTGAGVAADNTFYMECWE